MYTESRYVYYKGDRFDPKVEADKSLVAGEEMVSLDITSVLVSGEYSTVQQLVLKLGLDHAKLLVQKLQEGIDKHENEIGN